MNPYAVEDDLNSDELSGKDATKDASEEKEPPRDVRFGYLRVCGHAFLLTCLFLAYTEILHVADINKRKTWKIRWERESVCFDWHWTQGEATNVHMLHLFWDFVNLGIWMTGDFSFCNVFVF